MLRCIDNEERFCLSYSRPYRPREGIRACVWRCDGHSATLTPTSNPTDLLRIPLSRPKLVTKLVGPWKLASGSVGGTCLKQIMEVTNVLKPMDLFRF